MSDWKRVKISEVSDFFIGGTPSRSNSKLWAEKPSGHPWIAISDLKKKYISDTEEHITGSGVIFSNVKEIPPESVVMSFKLSIGKAAITKQLMYCNEAIVFFKPNEDLSSRWLYHAIPKAANAVIVDTAVKGSTLNKKKIADIELFLPGIEEQTTIATILDTLDTQIRQTEAIIAKLQQVKQGLLHDLLTRGIDENGQLSPPYEQAPELYKDSPLGWIPKEWEVLRLATLSENGLSNGVFKEPKRVGKGVPLINVADLYRGDRLALEACELFDASPGEVKRYGARKGDIFYTRSSLKLEGIAQTSYLNSETKSAVYECHVMRLRPNKNLVFPRYLKEWCVGSFARKHFMEHAKQVTMTTISQDGIAGLLCPKPDLDEQEKCVAMIESHESRILKELNLVKKLKKQKAGLMDDLLTGRVRVTELIEQEKQAS